MSVKVPVVPNIGTIGVGIAKAGADIITLSGFEGGTGAARTHALRHVGLPSDIGTRAVHLALMEAGIRNCVEIWADGGYRHAHDIVKLHCLGANRVGFGTLAMVSLGCTICRGCQLDTCHVGIATQIESEQEAQLKGLKKFTPQEFERAAESCARFFAAMGEEVRELTASLGFERSQDLVGRSDLLVQARATRLRRPARADPPDRRHARSRAARHARRRRTSARPRAWSAASPIRMRAGASSAAPRGARARRRRTRWTPLTACSAPSWRGRWRAGGSAATGRPQRATRWPRCASAAGSIGGQGLGAFNVHGVDITVEGGAQDGVAKAMLGGKVSVMKGLNRLGRRLNGSVGKSFAYGAQRGRLFVQGDADSRFCIRLSGADVVIGGEPRRPLDDSLGCVADRANLKGFAFEYMTDGRAVVLGDPGPWFCAGQTGGRVYLRVNDEWGLDREALERRRGKGAKVALEALDAQGMLDVEELLGWYADELRATGQDGEAHRIGALAGDAAGHFLMVVPEREQTDPSVSTE